MERFNERTEEEFNPRDYSRYEDLPEEERFTGFREWSTIEVKYLALEGQDERDAFYPDIIIDDCDTFKPTGWKAQAADVVSGDAHYSGSFVRAEAIDDPAKAEIMARVEKEIRETFDLEQQSRDPEESHFEYILSSTMYGLETTSDEEVLKKTAEWARKTWYVDELILAGRLSRKVHCPKPLDLALLEKDEPTDSSPAEWSNNTLSHVEAIYRYAQEQLSIDEFDPRFTDDDFGLRDLIESSHLEPVDEPDYQRLQEPETWANFSLVVDAGSEEEEEEKRHIAKAMGILSDLGLLEEFDDEIKHLTKQEFAGEYQDKRPKYRRIAYQAVEFCTFTSPGFVDYAYNFAGNPERIKEIIGDIALMQPNGPTSKKIEQYRLWFEAARSLRAIE